MIISLRPLFLSLLLHAAALFFLLNLATTTMIEKPVVIDLAVTTLPNELTGRIADKAARMGGSKLPAANKTPSPQKASNHEVPAQVKASAKDTAQMNPDVKTPAKSVPVSQLPVALAQQHPPVRSELQSGKQPANEMASPASNSSGSTGSSKAGNLQTGGGTAFGSSGPSGSGRGGGSGAGNSPEQLRRKYLNENFAYIQKLIQNHLTYPAMARRQGLEGKVRVSFVILENGQVTNLKVLDSSGYEILDDDAVETVKDTAPFPKPPIKAELHIPLTYRLER